MAVAYGAVSTHSPAWGISPTGNTNVTLPSGTAVGDLLVVFLDFHGHQDETFDITSNAGALTNLLTRTAAFSRPNSDYYYYQAAYCYPNATDISNGYITISSSATHSSTAKVTLVRVTGATPTGSMIQIANATNVSATTTPSYAMSITPTYVNSLLLMHIDSSPYNNGSLSSSGYAIATDNPTWTEIEDSSTSSGDDGHSATAYAVRTANTATGNASCTLSASKVSGGILVCIPPQLDATATVSAVTLTASTLTPAVTGSAVVPASAVSLTTSVPTPTVTTPAPEWINVDKTSTPAWTNPDKS